jgi:hypothetical protein
LYAVRGYLHKGAWVINLEYTKGDTKKLFSIMYYSDNILFLERKHNKIRNAFVVDNVTKINRQTREMPQ